MVVSNIILTIVSTLIITKTKNMKIPILYIEENKVHEWTLEQILEQINFGRSNEWTDYDENDWVEGWNEWVEHEGYYSLVDFVEYNGKKYPTFNLVVDMPDVGENNIRVASEDLTDAFKEKHLDFGTPEYNIDCLFYHYVENATFGCTEEEVAEKYLDIPMKLIEE